MRWVQKVIARPGVPLQERILDFLLSVDDVAERNALLLDAFTPLSVCSLAPISRHRSRVRCIPDLVARAERCGSTGCDGQEEDRQASADGDGDELVSTTPFRLLQAINSQLAASMEAAKTDGPSVQADTTTTPRLLQLREAVYAQCDEGVMRSEA